MTSQIVANIDSELKKTAMTMAKKNGITLKSLITFLLRSYVEGEMTIGAKIKREYYTGLEIEEWNTGEMKILENDKGLKTLENKFNKLIMSKGM